MEPESVAPFENIEGAQEYITLLSQAVVESQEAVKDEIETQENCASLRHLEALRLILYKLDTLGQHLRISSRILNDLRTLRRLLHQERAATMAQADAAC